MQTNESSTSSRPQQQDGRCVIKDFAFQTGGTFPELQIAFTTLGRPLRDANGDVANAVMLLHATGGDRTVWLRPSIADELFAPGKPLDASGHFIILADVIGHGQSSRPSASPGTAFPRYGCLDQINALRILATKALHIRRFRAILGVSLGGMLAWTWGTLHPDMTDALVPIGAEPFALSGRNRIIRRIMIDSIRGDSRWMGGAYEHNPTPHIPAAVLLFLMAEGAAGLQRRAPTGAAADAYLHRLLTQQVGRIDANDLLYALECTLDYDPSSGLDRIKAGVLAIDFMDDELVPIEINRTSQALSRLQRARHFVVPASEATQGHLTYLQARTWAPALGEFLQGL